MAGAAITYDHDGGSGLMGAFAAGTYTADDTTPVAVNILCGFKPSMIVIFDIDTVIEYSWHIGLAETLGDTPAAGLKTVTGSTGVLTYAATGGPTYYPGVDATTEDGFTIPAAMQTADDVLTWIAYR